MSDAPNHDSVQVEPTAQVERDRQMINEARQQGTGSLFLAFTKLSGPGWLQSAITLGGGSLAGSLYLGVLAGYGAMWWQPLAMILGVIMLSAIGYVTLSTGERPFDAINKHINPVLGWSWAIATLMANLVWCMPQYGLGTAALRKNLMPETLGDANQWVAIGLLFVVTGIVIVFYDAGGWAVKVFDLILKAMVGIVVISFFAVVVRMSLAGDLDWGQILTGFIPNFSTLQRPSAAFADVLANTGEFRSYWENVIVSEQRDAMIASAATAVGINMTFLLPYSMLRKGWDRDFRGLAIFDLSTGLFIPYLLATSCVVIASATAFHAQEAPGLVAEFESEMAASAKLQGGYVKLLDSRLAEEHGEAWQSMDDTQQSDLRASLPDGDRRIAAMIIRRDTDDFAAALSRLSDETTAQKVFGIGVLGMAVSTIIILMLINGFVLTEILGKPGHKGLHLLGCFLASICGAVGSATLWTGDAKAYLAVPTSLFGMVLLPIAYITFLLMMNSRSLLGENKPTGMRMLQWNGFMILATAFATFCCLWSINNSSNRVLGFSALAVLAVLTIIVHFASSKKPS